MTELLHLTYDGNFKLESNATVLMSSVCNEEGKGTDIQLQLDVTPMHPQGGGQPTDTGKISSENGTSVIVKFVSLDRSSDIVTHTCSVSPDDDLNAIMNDFSVGSKVKVFVDADRRRILSECHTAGHVVDSAMAKCGQTLQPIKGYHFSEGPYVEYKGTIPLEERAELLESLKEAFSGLLDEDIETRIETLIKDDAEAICNRLQQNFDFSGYEREVRIVTAANMSSPCGGTHVRSTGELKARGWNVVGIKSKKGAVRVRYAPSS